VDRCANQRDQETGTPSYQTAFGQGDRQLRQGFPLRSNSLQEPGFALRYATERGALSLKGQIIAQPDLFIAATALRHNLLLLTRNRRHFERIPELPLKQATVAGTDDDGSCGLTRRRASQVR
jgi:hypothetical protein